MKIKLFVNPYAEANEARKGELAYCLKRNVDSGYFASVVTVPGRPTFNEFFNSMRELGDGCVCILANSDIFFDGTIGHLRDYYAKGGTAAMALSRWDVQSLEPFMSHLWSHKDSQDAWVFPTPPDPIEGADFGLGIPGCDNRILRLMEDAGHRVINPSKTIKAHHLHLSGVRNYGQGRGKPKAYTVPGPYAFCEPTELIKL